MHHPNIFYMTEEQKDPGKPKLRLSRDSEDSKVEDAQPDTKNFSTPPNPSTPPEDHPLAPKQTLKLKRQNAESTTEAGTAPTPEQNADESDKSDKSDVTTSRTEPETKSGPKTAPAPKNESIQDKIPAHSIKKEPEPKQSPPPQSSPPKIPKQPAGNASDEVGAKVEKSADYLEEKESSNLLSSILILFALIALLGGSGFGLYYILKSPADDVATADTPGTSGGSLSGPINKAKDVAAKKAALVESASPVIEADDSTDSNVDEQTVEPPDPDGSGDSKQTASDFLTNASLGGVRSGDNAKVILNGESFSKGDLVETNTGLRFIGIKDKKLVFRDANGTVYIKSF